MEDWRNCDGDINILCEICPHFEECGYVRGLLKRGNP